MTGRPGTAKLQPMTHSARITLLALVALLLSACSLDAQQGAQSPQDGDAGAGPASSSVCYLNGVEAVLVDQQWCCQETCLSVDDPRISLTPTQSVQ